MIARSFQSLQFKPVLDPDFRPIIREYLAFQATVKTSEKTIPFSIAIERENRQISTFELQIFQPQADPLAANIFMVERLVKTMLWLRGGWKIILSGSAEVGEAIAGIYSRNGARAFDWQFMQQVYGRALEVEVRLNYEDRPQVHETSVPASRNLDGCRIGLDLGGSDYKFCAVIDGQPVFSQEIIWHPKLQSDPDYHAECIRHALNTAASHLPGVDAIGISAAGIYINNEVKVASLFIQVPQQPFAEKVKRLFYQLTAELGENMPFEVRNDGDVAALAGAMSLNTDRVLGIAMGTSQASGYVNHEGNITGWLNELAFTPIDLNPNAMLDEWSGDRGCGVKYFSQDAVIKLCPAAGIPVNEADSPAEKLKMVQALIQKEDLRALRIYETIGVYLGYALPYYAMFYDINEVLLLGRVTSGPGGQVILEQAQRVLNTGFLERDQKIKIRLPDEQSRRVGQAIAAASLPTLRERS